MSEFLSCHRNLAKSEVSVSCFLEMIALGAIYLMVFVPYSNLDRRSMRERPGSISSMLGFIHLIKSSVEKWLVKVDARSLLKDSAFDGW